MNTVKINGEQFEVTDSQLDVLLNQSLLKDFLPIILKLKVKPIMDRAKILRGGRHEIVMMVPTYNVIYNGQFVCHFVRI